MIILCATPANAGKNGEICNGASSDVFVRRYSRCRVQTVQRSYKADESKNQGFDGEDELRGKDRADDANRTSRGITPSYEGLLHR